MLDHHRVGDQGISGPCRARRSSERPYHRAEFYCRLFGAGGRSGMIGKFSDLVGLFFFGFVALFAGFWNLVLSYPIESVLLVLIAIAIKQILRIRREHMKNFI